ncbi:MAG: MoaD/ThiS family protein [Candidatus Glassbacteria bacterium]
MKIVVKLFAKLREFGPEYQEMEVPEDTLLEDLIELLKLPDDLPALKIVNGIACDLQQPLREGDEVALFPPIAGG